jgi:hypothetical protein
MFLSSTAYTRSEPVRLSVTSRHWLADSRLILQATLYKRRKFRAMTFPEGSQLRLLRLQESLGGSGACSTASGRDQLGGGS